MVKRNVDQFASCLSNLHLSLVLMTLKRGLLTEQISFITGGKASGVCCELSLTQLQYCVGKGIEDHC